MEGQNLDETQNDFIEKKFRPSFKERPEDRKVGEPQVTRASFAQSFTERF